MLAAATTTGVCAILLGETGDELVADLPDEAFASSDFYLAGPPPMTDAVVGLLTKERRVPSDRIHYDRFF